VQTSSLTNIKIGYYLRQAREATGMTQEQLAFETELHRTYISLVERGERCPTVTVLFQICDALHVRPDVIVAQAYQEVASIRGKA
jgi:transcriptional regulator with XRE-family HTH domain